MNRFPELIVERFIVEEPFLEKTVFFFIIKAYPAMLQKPKISEKSPDNRMVVRFMKLQTLTYFLQLSKMENLSQTADYFNISQPALSKQIKLLESELHLQLFDRFGNYLKLNETGRQYASYVERALLLLDSGKEYTRKMRYEIAGHITIAFQTPESFFTHCISSYVSLNPKVQFNLVRQGNETGNSLAEEPDFVLYSHEPENYTPHKTWCFDPLMEEHYAAVMAPDYPPCQAFKTTRELQLLQDASFITVGNAWRQRQDVTSCICIGAGFYPNFQLRTDDLMAAVQLIADRAGIGFLSEFSIPQVRLLAPELLVIPIHGYRRYISIAHRREERMTEIAQDFLAYILDYYGR